MRISILTSPRSISVFSGRYHIMSNASIVNNCIIFHGCKNVHFHMENLNILLIVAQNVDCGYTLEPVLTSTHNLCFGAKIRKKYTPVSPSFT